MAQTIIVHGKTRGLTILLLNPILQRGIAGQEKKARKLVFPLNAPNDEDEAGEVLWWALIKQATDHLESSP